LERYSREYNVAKNEYEQERQHNSLLNGASREVDVAIAQGGLRLAVANEAQAQAQAQYDKTFIKSSIDGIVLRKHHRNGESISNSAVSTDPMLTGRACHRIGGPWRYSNSWRLLWASALPTAEANPVAYSTERRLSCVIPSLETTWRSNASPPCPDCSIGVTRKW